MKILKLTETEEYFLDYLLSAVSNMPEDLIKKYFNRNGKNIFRLLTKLRKAKNEPYTKERIIAN